MAMVIKLYRPVRKIKEVILLTFIARHNAGVGSTQARVKNEDGMGMLFAVNSLAPYVLTALMARPKRLIYTSSMLHSGGDGTLKDVTNATYGDSKLHKYAYLTCFLKPIIHTLPPCTFPNLPRRSKPLAPLNLSTLV